MDLRRHTETQHSEATSRLLHSAADGVSADAIVEVDSSPPGQGGNDGAGSGGGGGLDGSACEVVDVVSVEANATAEVECDVVMEDTDDENSPLSPGMGEEPQPLNLHVALTATSSM